MPGGKLGSLTQDEKIMEDQKLNLTIEQTNMAKIRTEMAFDRTTLTNTQSLLAYIRTGISILAAGIGMFEFIDNEQIVKFGIIFMVVSPFIVAFGIVQYFIFKKKLKNQKNTVLELLEK